MKPLFLKKLLWPLLSALLFLAVWQTGAAVLGSSLLLPVPWEVGRYFFSMLTQASFYNNLWATFLRGIFGFFLAFIWGLMMGIGASLVKPVKWLLQPYLILARSVPLLALILLAVIWFRQNQVPYFIVFLIVFPLITSNVSEGIATEDPDLLDMAKSFQFSWKDRLIHIAIPHLTPFLLSGISTGLGIAWKAVIAAEIITMPGFAIGSAMQRAQLELDSQALFAWTLTILLVSSFCEWMIRLAGRRIPWNSGKESSDG